MSRCGSKYTIVFETMFGPGPVAVARMPLNVATAGGGGQGVTAPEANT
jgi:hypothetical protein